VCVCVCVQVLWALIQFIEWQSGQLGMSLQGGGNVNSGRLGMSIQGGWECHFIEQQYIRGTGNVILLSSNISG